MNSYIALGETDDNEYLSKDGSPVSDQVAAKFLTIMYGRLYEKNSLIQNRRSLSKYESLFVAWILTRFADQFKTTLYAHFHPRGIHNTGLYKEREAEFIKMRGR